MDNEFAMHCGDFILDPHWAVMIAVMPVKERRRKTRFLSVI